MRQKVADYIADFLVRRGIVQVFTVVGGGAMHMNEAFGHHPGLRCLYHHHEQAAAMAAEGYAKLSGRMAAVCVTSGPGAVNALNGVAGAYQDSTPMLVLSGQTKTALTVRHSGLALRTLGNQEFDIVSALSNMTKYAEMVAEPTAIRAALEKAVALAQGGRPGPCWLDIPLDVQGAYIETEALPGWQGEADGPQALTGAALEAAVHTVLEKLAGAKRPVLYAGNGLRLAGAAGLVEGLAQRLALPVVTCWDSVDLIATDSPYYCGRAGTMGDRAGNFAVQNSDVLLVIGSRLNIYQVGYDVRTWARGAYTIVADIDPEELKKPTIRVDLPLAADAKQLAEGLLAAAPAAPPSREAWLRQCQAWKQRYPVVTQAHYAEAGACNVYAFVDALTRAAGPGAVTVVSNGSASVVGSAASYIGQGSRFLMNCGMSSMGYGLPAAIGAAVAAKGKPILCLEGDGSVMMNLQELQTMATNKLPIRLFIINNGGYFQIRQTQTNVFGTPLVGVGPDSHDLGFPDFKTLAAAFGLPYRAIRANAGLKDGLAEALSAPGGLVCEVFCSLTQKFEPKSATKKLADGSLWSPPLEDLAPFLPREELAANMYIPLMEEQKKG